MEKRERDTINKSSAGFSMSIIILVNSLIAELHNKMRNEDFV
jgi:hypothetical protein